MLMQLPLRHRIAALASAYVLLMLACIGLLLHAGAKPWLAIGIAALCLLPMWLHLLRLHAPVRAMYRALAGTVDSYRDGDFAFSLAWHRRDELAELVAAHNRLGESLREQRVALVQRELLLDTIVQNTPVAMTLVDPAGRVVLGNLAARKLLGEGRRIEGQAFASLMDAAPEGFKPAFERGGDAIFVIGNGDDEDIHHLSRRQFRLNGRRHELILLRQLTAELRRQEVQTWKKVIRVISHELNNSLAPIASLAHSGGELLRRGQYEKLPLALTTIEERARHLEGFIRDYARFAKLPAPRLQSSLWHPFLRQLQSQVAFGWDGQHGDAGFRADLAQLEQALLNVLKNAHEAGGDADAVQLQLRRHLHGWRIDILDRGSGMSDAVLAQALLPFYSTKRNGTGLGMALTREIIEAHGGHVALANREGGGLCVSLSLPD